MQYSPEAMARRLLQAATHPRCQYTGRTKREHIPTCSLTYEWILERVKAGCELTGVAFDLSTGLNGSGNPLTASIDRIDHDGDYTPANCRVILWGLNKMRGRMTDERLFAVLDALTEAWGRRGKARLAQRQEARCEPTPRPEDAGGGA